jgi:hypothetical protein
MFTEDKITTLEAKLDKQRQQLKAYETKFAVIEDEQK